MLAAAGGRRLSQPSEQPVAQLEPIVAMGTSNLLAGYGSSIIQYSCLKTAAEIVVSMAWAGKWRGVLILTS